MKYKSGEKILLGDRVGIVADNPKRQKVSDTGVVYDAGKDGVKVCWDNYDYANCDYVSLNRIGSKRLNLIARSAEGILVGDSVVDFQGNRGVVVKIDIWDNPSIENHGTIFVWQCDRTEYGADNCEHYPHFGWEKLLFITSER
jgi:hypothetical protein